nr:hypothetical protein [Mycoplasmopsis bovis]
MTSYFPSIAVFVGPISIGLWSRFNLKRRWFVGMIISLAVLFFVLSTIVFVYGVAKDQGAYFAS